MSCLGGVIRWLLAMGLVWGPLSPVILAQTPETNPSPADGASINESPPSNEPDTSTVVTEQITPRILKAPTTDDELQARIEMVRKRLEELRPTTEPATTAPATAPAGEVEIDGESTSRVDILTTYLNELLSWQKTRARIKTLGKDESIESLSNQIRAWQELEKDYRERKPPQWRFLIESSRDAVLRALSEYRGELDEMVNAQTLRETQSANLPARVAATKKSVTQTLERLNAYLDQLPTQLNEAGSNEARERLLITKAILEWRHNLELVRAAALGDTDLLLKLETQRGADSIAALTPLVESIQAYRARLETRRAESAVKNAEEQLAREDLREYEKLYWQLIRDANRGVAQTQDLAQRLQHRFPPSDLTHLTLRIENGERYLTRFLESLGRREGQSILEAYNDAIERLAEDRRLLVNLQQQLDDTLVEQRLAIEQRDAIEDRIRIGRAALDERITQLTGADLIDARKKQVELTSGPLSTVEGELKSLETAHEELISRLSQATEMISNHIESWERFGARLQWTALSIPEANLFQHDYTEASREFASVWNRSGPAYENLNVQHKRALRDFGAIPLPTLINTGLLAALTYYLGRRLRSKLRSERAEFLGQREHRVAASEELQDLANVPSDGGAGSQPNLGERAHYQVMRVVGESSRWILPLAVMLPAITVFRPPGASFPLLTILLISCLLGTLAITVINTLFDATRPVWRMLRVRTETARYHRRWLRILTIAFWVTMPIVMGFRAIDVLPVLRETCWLIAKLIILVIAFVYTVRRRYFAPGKPVGLPWEFALLVHLSPLLPLIVAAIFVLQAMGYSPLTEYLIRGVVLTIVVLGVEGFLRQLLSQWIHLNVTQPAAGSDPSATREDAVSTGQVQAVLLTVLQLARFLLSLSVVFLLLPIWGVRISDIIMLLRYPLTSAEDPVTPLAILTALVVIAAGIFASRTLRAYLYAQIFPDSPQLDRGAQTAIATLSHYAVIAVAIFIAMKTVKLDFGALAVLFGTIGLGLGLGLQPLFVNFVSGLMILLERQVKVGDTIDVGGQLGEVRGISMRSTHVRSFDGIDIVIPNSEFISSNVTNWTMQDTIVRARVTVGVSYAADPLLVKKILLGIAHKHPNVLVDPTPTVWFLDFADSALIFDLVCWFATPPARWEFMTQVRFEIMKEFAKHGIEIPFPQRTLSFLGGTPMPVTMQENLQKSEIPSETPGEEDRATIQDDSK